MKNLCVFRKAGSKHPRRQTRYARIVATGAQRMAGSSHGDIQSTFTVDVAGIGRLTFTLEPDEWRSFVGQIDGAILRLTPGYFCSPVLPQNTLTRFGQRP